MSPGQTTTWDREVSGVRVSLLDRKKPEPDTFGEFGAQLLPETAKNAESALNGGENQLTGIASLGRCTYGTHTGRHTEVTLESNQS